jgi:hypothetical protein
LKKKHFIAPALALGLIGGFIAVPNAIFADSDAAVTDSATSTAVTQDAGKTTTGDHVITPQRARDVFNDTFETEKNPVSRFVLDPGYGHLKIMVKNTGDSTMTFSLVHTDSNKQYIVKTVGAHSGLTWDSTNSFSQGLRSGNYEIQWRAGGDIVHGSASGVSGQYPSDID